MDLEVPHQLPRSPRSQSFGGFRLPRAELLRTNWWPMISLVVFKSPPEGRTHLFKAGEPCMQMLFAPAEPEFELPKMNEEEAAERELRGRRIHAGRDTLSKDTWWTSSTNTVFDGTYRHLLRAAKARDKERTG